jgi:hypothetical protein
MVNGLREGFSPEFAGTVTVTELFHNERGKAGEVVGGSFVLVVGF